MVPSPLIILSFLATFILCSWQYYRIDPERRVLNARFGLMFSSIVGAFGYPIYLYEYPGDRRMSWIMFVAAIVWLGLAWYLLRRIPPRETD
jgi:hypothetical protein